jgi:hypothetical protein
MFTPTALAPATLPAVMAMRAAGQDGTGDAAEQGLIISDISCAPSNPNCTWSVTQSGLILNDKNSSLGLNAWNGPTSGQLEVTQYCDINNAWNPDCTWRLNNNNSIGTDDGNEVIYYSQYGWNTMDTASPTGSYFLASMNFSITRAAD